MTLFHTTAYLAAFAALSHLSRLSNIVLSQYLAIWNIKATSGRQPILALHHLPALPQREPAEKADSSLSALTPNLPWRPLYLNNYTSPWFY